MGGKDNHQTAEFVALHFLDMTRELCNNVIRQAVRNKPLTQALSRTDHLHTASS